MPDETTSLDKPQRGSGVPPTPSSPPAAGKAEKKSKTETAEADLQNRIRFRQVRTMALADPAVIKEWDHSNVARTDAEKRAALRQFYKLLFARMAKIDPTLKTQIDLQASSSDRRLTQTHITPTEVDNEADRSTSGRVFAE